MSRPGASLPRRAFGRSGVAETVRELIAEGHLERLAATVGEPGLERGDELGDEAVGLLVRIVNDDRMALASPERLADEAADDERLDEVDCLGAIEPLDSNRRSHPTLSRDARETREVAAPPLRLPAER